MKVLNTSLIVHFKCIWNQFVQHLFYFRTFYPLFICTNRHNNNNYAEEKHSAGTLSALTDQQYIARAQCCYFHCMFPVMHFLLCWTCWLARPSHASLSAVIAVCHCAYYVYSFSLLFGWLHYFHYSSHVSIKQPITIGSVVHGTNDDSKFNWQKNLLMFSSMAPNQFYKCVYKCFHSLSEDAKQRTQNCSNKTPSLQFVQDIMWLFVSLCHI